MTEDITTAHIKNDTMEYNDFEQKIAQLHARFPLRSRRELEETLEVVNNDLDKGLAFLAHLGPRVPSIQSQNSSVTAGPQKRASAQVLAGGDVHPGQKGVLDLRTMEWTALNEEQRSAHARQSGTNHEGALPSTQAVLTVLPLPPGSNTQSS